MTNVERILLNQITIMKALQLCLRQAPPVSTAEAKMITELEGLVVLSQRHLDGGGIGYDFSTLDEPEVKS